MMCAPITLTGSGGDKANFDALADMFKANIGNGCGTQDSSDLVFPDPGKILERNNGATSAFLPPTGTGCPPAVATRPAAGSAAGGSSSGVPAAGTSAPGGGGGGGGYFKTEPVQSVSDASTTVAPSSPTSTTVAPLPATTTAASGTTGSGTASSSGAGGALTGACASEGTFHCIDGTRFQQCGSGKWSVAMPVAPGTKCAVGSGPELKVGPAKLRFRGVRFEG